MVCFRLFHFIVQRKISSEDIKINYVMTNREPCHINVFCAVHGIKAAVSWNISHGEGTVAQLQFPSLHTVPYFDEYKGISGSVLNVSRVNPELTYSCTAKTRFSTASRSATPWEYCQQGKISSENININYLITDEEACSVNVFCTVYGIRVPVSWNVTHGVGAVSQLTFPHIEYGTSFNEENKNIYGAVLEVHNADPELTYSCTAATATNATSISVRPWEYCQQGGTLRDRSYTIENTIRLVLAVCILLSGSLLCYCHINTELN
ncbi:hypothetical protein XENTR_v10022560 [Xenopus tropicalis]|nr:hypothetical protein XENTR_v10022560 [Xenopus tropicalis]|eukprot:XP_017945247.1 PREDICTED: uncharacterized protein LOC101734717 [Xenopus tropicalis]